MKIGLAFHRRSNSEFLQKLASQCIAWTFVWLEMTAREIPAAGEILRVGAAVNHKYAVRSDTSSNLNMVGHGLIPAQSWQRQGQRARDKDKVLQRPRGTTGYVMLLLFAVLAVFRVKPGSSLLAACG